MKQESKKTVTDYLASLVWDGIPRIERWLIDRAGADDTPYVRAVSRAVLIAAVRRARQPGCPIDAILVLEGPQGTGKSSALRILAVNDDWFTDDIPMGSREVVEATAGKWIVEAGELKGMGKGDVAALKAFLAAREDTGPRPAYQRKGAKVPRHFVIVGTTSETEYLRDSTGNRRFWPVRVGIFDLGRLRAERDQLWAEAVAAEAAGEAIVVPAATEAMEDQEERVVEDQEQHAYVVIDDRWGAAFSSQSLDAACVFVSAKLREQAAKTSLANPSSFRIVRVKAG